MTETSLCAGCVVELLYLLELADQDAHERNLRDACTGQYHEGEALVALDYDVDDTTVVAVNLALYHVSIVAVHVLTCRTEESVVAPTIGILQVLVHAEVHPLHATCGEPAACINQPLAV